MAAGLTPSIPDELACLTVTSDENDCVCRSTLLIKNGCSEALEAVGFEFCGEPYYEDCPTLIEPGFTGELFMPREGSSQEPGAHSVALELTLGETVHSMAVSYEMVHIENGGCNSSGSTGGMALGALAFAALYLRRRKRLE